MTYSIERADLKRDKAEILRICQANLPNFPTQASERFDWMYLQNPAGQGLCWKATSSEGNMVGITSVFPCRLLVRGQALLAGIAGDFAVDKRFRAFGPALQLQKAAISEIGGEMQFVYGLPNHQAEPLQLRAGYRSIGQITRLIKPMSAPYLAERFLGSDSRLARAATILDPVLRLFSRATFYRSRRRYRKEVLSEFDQRFQPLWHLAAAQHPIAGERSVELLNWRIAQCPYRRSNILALIDSNSGEVSAYIASYSEGRRTFITDLLARDEDAWMEAVIAEFLKRQAKQPTEFVSIMCFGAARLTAVLRDFGFVRRPDMGPLLLSERQNFPCGNTLSDVNNWYLLEASTDL